MKDANAIVKELRKTSQDVLLLHEFANSGMQSFLSTLEMEHETTELKVVMLAGTSQKKHHQWFVPEKKQGCQ